MKTTIDPSRRLELYIRKARNGSKTFVFTNSSGADYDISSFDFELFIKKNAGARKDVISLLTSYAGFGLSISTNELTATFTDVITDIDAGEYYWELLRLDTNKTWLCGPCYVHEGEFDGVETDTSTISIADTTTVTVSITDGISNPRVYSVNTTATLTINVDSYDQANVTALSEALTIANPTGTPSDGQGLLIRIDPRATAYALTFGSQFNPFGSALPTTTQSNLGMYIAAFWNAARSTWDTTYNLEV